MAGDRVKELSVNTGLPRLPGGRLRSEGPNSAQEFRDDHLAPALKDEDAHGQVHVVFDGVTDFSGAWLNEAFGGLVREHNLSEDALRKRLRISTSDGDLQDYVRLAGKYMARALAEPTSKPVSAFRPILKLQGDI